MKKYLVIYHAPAEAMAQMATMTPEQKAEGMKPWAAWMEGVGEKLTDPGSPFLPGVRISPEGTTKPSENEVTGYSILHANDMEEAQSLVKNHPHLKWTEGCAVEVFEAIPMG